jgi:tartrate dehydratase beta subunit/fumarate hydratase class I family protein
MGPGTAEALSELGGVHLSKIGICGNQLLEQVLKVHAVYFLEELGRTEATWVFEVERFGPFFVDMDARGNNYFDALEKRADCRLADAYRSLGISEDYTFTEV